jgi:hypothetical protein
MGESHSGGGRREAIEHDPEKWEPIFGKDHAPTKSCVIPKKWKPVFGKDHAQTRGLERDDESTIPLQTMNEEILS